MRKPNLCCLEPQRNVHKTNKKTLKVSKVLAQLDTDVLIREIMCAIKGLVLEKKIMVLAAKILPVKSTETKP